jgi:hypothetical protein
MAIPNIIKIIAFAKEASERLRQSHQAGATEPTADMRKMASHLAEALADLGFCAENEKRAAVDDLAHNPDVVLNLIQHLLLTKHAENQKKKCQVCGQKPCVCEDGQCGEKKAAVLPGRPVKTASHSVPTRRLRDLSLRPVHELF